MRSLCEEVSQRFATIYIDNTTSNFCVTLPAPEEFEVLQTACIYILNTRLLNIALGKSGTALNVEGFECRVVCPQTTECSVVANINILDIGELNCEDCELGVVSHINLGQSGVVYIKLDELNIILNIYAGESGLVSVEIFEVLQARSINSGKCGVVEQPNNLQCGVLAEVNRSEVVVLQAELFQSGELLDTSNGGDALLGCFDACNLLCLANLQLTIVRKVEVLDEVCLQCGVLNGDGRLGRGRESNLVAISGTFAVGCVSANIVGHIGLQAVNFRYEYAILSLVDGVKTSEVGILRSAPAYTASNYSVATVSHDSTTSGCGLEGYIAHSGSGNNGNGRKSGETLSLAIPYTISVLCPSTNIIDSTYLQACNLGSPLANAIAIFGFVVSNGGELFTCCPADTACGDCSTAIVSHITAALCAVLGNSSNLSGRDLHGGVHGLGLATKCKGCRSHY